MKSNNTIKLTCMVVDDDEVSRSIITHFIKKTDYLELQFSCESAVEAHNLLKKDPDLDIIFLDVEMPEMTGMELLQTLDDRTKNVILTTSREKYAVEAFEYDVSDYLVKPINYARFLKATAKVLKKVTEEMDVPVDSNYLFVRVNHKIVKISPKDILYIEALSDYILIHTDKNRYIVHSTMKGIEEKLESFKSFTRIHRSYIVNLDHLESVQDINVVVNNKSIPIGRSYRNQFIERLNIL
ncbi:MAG: LytTR family DNA-binding domain-containing protein [Microscillaceae bacterium]|nr:LytTR family DNA-binding domain-containing protein [Microscillaceae bacterium]